MRTTTIKTWVFIYVWIPSRIRIPMFLWGWCACVNSGAQAVSSPPEAAWEPGMVRFNSNTEIYASATELPECREISTHARTVCAARLSIWATSSHHRGCCLTRRTSQHQYQSLMSGRRFVQNIVHCLTKKDVECQEAFKTLKRIL